MLSFRFRVTHRHASPGKRNKVDKWERKNEEERIRERERQRERKTEREKERERERG